MTVFVKGLFLFILFCTPSFAEEPDDKEPVKIGNFSLTTSQQMGAFISFGQNVIDKGEKQAFFMASDVEGSHSYAVTATPSLLIALSDELSIFFNVPFSPSNRDRGHHSSGINDAFVQLEYAFYSDEGKTFFNQATVVTNVAIPTGSSRKDPSTGCGSTSFFIGLTYAHTDVDWFYFVSPGATHVTSYHDTQFGDQLLYQAGLGKNILGTADWIVSWLLEFDGEYTRRNRIHGITDSNSGGNVIVITPSLWLSGKNLILQAGIGWPVVQQLQGEQAKQNYTIDINLGWTF